MTRDHRFHLDREGHSVTVRTGTAREPTEVLVDGKVVAARHRRGHRERVIQLTAELPGDPPRPVTVRVDWRTGAGSGPVCVMEAEGTCTVIPRASPGPSAPRPAVRVLARHPLRWLRRHLPRHHPPPHRTARRLR
ncbi:hypothetical protein [Streptomyces lavenduligriseus]|uniref:Uncharacterized protein n=1 Tax=Streptomyces lavenduligriseus TaxID=67315 RepID=A0ABT0NMJ3_9ACTN|nr:hypothetical protein [Streptomyces lavenduligriseus]MCL3992674.1 hypothetical protein [Streptomyces lavenduligriseus]